MTMCMVEVWMETRKKEVEGGAGKEGGKGGGKGKM